MSVGNQTQAVDLNRQDLTLVLGENLDLGGDDAGARNGTGKTTITLPQYFKDAGYHTVGSGYAFYPH